MSVKYQSNYNNYFFKYENETLKMFNSHEDLIKEIHLTISTEKDFQVEIMWQVESYEQEKNALPSYWEE